MSEPLSIAQVTAAPVDATQESVRQARLIADGLADLGHRVVILAPASSAAEAGRSRRAVTKAAGDGESLLPAPGEAPRIIAIGEATSISPRSRRSLPTGITRAVEEVLGTISLDIAHLHDPLLPTLPAAALRYSSALNIAHFHDAQPRFPAGNMGRKVGGAFYGRVDAALCSWASALPIINASVPAGATELLPALQLTERPPTGDQTVVSYLATEERSALRTVLKALKSMTADTWVARIGLAPGATPLGPLGPALRERVEVVEVKPGDEEAFLAGTDIAITASATTPNPLSILKAVAAGAVPIATTLEAHKDVLGEGRIGSAFMPGDAQTLAAQLDSLITDSDRRVALGRQADELRTELSTERLAREVEAVCEGLIAKRHDTRADRAVAKRIAGRKFIDVDLHMHTDHSYDCATPVEVLLAEAKARGLGAIAVTDHNEISGALEAREKASGIKVIVGEEVKTKDQGEVIGLFIEKLIPAGLSLAETLERIHEQGGIAYVPHPFDRLHSVPDYEHLLDSIDQIDAIEIHNARVAIGEFNEEAARFAAKYRIPAGAGSDAHVAQGLGSVRIKMRDFDGPQEFLESLREADITRRPGSLLYVQALKFIQNKATPANARKASARRRVRRASRKS